MAAKCDDLVSNPDPYRVFTYGVALTLNKLFKAKFASTIVMATATLATSTRFPCVHQGWLFIPTFGNF